MQSTNFYILTMSAVAHGQKRPPVETNLHTTSPPCQKLSKLSQPRTSLINFPRMNAAQTDENSWTLRQYLKKLGQRFQSASHYRTHAPWVT